MKNKTYIPIHIKFPKESIIVEDYFYPRKGTVDGFRIIDVGTMQFGHGKEMEEFPYRYTKELGYQIFRENKWIKVVTS